MKLTRLVGECDEVNALPSTPPTRERSWCKENSWTLGEWFQAFEREAFRLETLADYSQSGGVDDDGTQCHSGR